ncbi:MAG TPA: HEAT repeat domain-containing protein [Capsulimonadaceae bacterium]|jgi:HEAT repeat protein
MTTKKSWVQGIVDAARARLVTTIVWIVILLVIYVAVEVNKSNHARTVANLSDPASRPAEVLKWAKQGRLADALAETQDPNTDDKSPANVASTKIREAAATDLNTLIASGTVSDDDALANLYALHKDTDGAVKASTVTGLAAVAAKSDANLTKLIARLADGDPDIRGASADALASIKTDAVIAKVVDAVNGNPPGAKTDALTTLSKIGKPAGPAIVSLMDTPDTAYRGQLITMLAGVADPRSIPALKDQALAEPRDPSLRRLSLLSLSAVVVATMPSSTETAAAAKPAVVDPAAKPAPPGPTPEEIKLALSAAPVLVAAINDPTDDSRARAQCALALGRARSPEAIAALVKALGDVDTRIAVAARSGLQASGPGAVGMIAGAVKNPSPQVRAGAAYALGGIGTPAALAAIAPALTDSSDDVRKAACQALGHSANPGAVAPLVARLADANGFVAGEAATSLQLLGKWSVPQLVAALGSTSPTAPIYATRALAAIGPDAAGPIMAAALSGSEKQKTWCAVALGRIHDPKSEAVLQTLAKSSDPSTKYAAEQALRQFGVV